MISPFRKEEGNYSISRSSSKKDEKERIEEEFKYMDK
jgi:hypothetical protein